MHLNLLPQLVGLISMVLLFISYQLNSRTQILVCQFFISVCWVVHYGLLGAISAVCINVICALRNILFSFRGKYKWASSLVLPAVVCAAEVISTLICWRGPVDILAMAGAPLQTAALWMKSPKGIRLLMLTASPLWMIYDGFNGSYVGILTESLVMLSIITALLRYDLPKKHQAEQ